MPSTITNDTRKELLNKMNSFITWDKPHVSKIVLLLDEAQHLLEEDGYAFRCIRWWLKEVTNTKSKSIVAVFAGTSSSLANFYREPAVPTSSRDGSKNHRESRSQFYPPFFDLCTVGCFVDQEATSNLASVPNASNLTKAGDSNIADFAIDTTTDLYRAIPYGRPLFTLMRNDNTLSAKLPVILDRLLLYEPEWRSNQASLFSVLATRVQLGQTATHIVSKLVGRGYGNLTDFSIVDHKPDIDPAAPGEHTTDGSEQGIAEIGYLTDPVCAYLAMGLTDVDGTWIVPNCPTKDEGKYKADSPKVWTARLLELCGTGMCRPNKGDLGEIGAALYLLFCGDRLRKKIDPTYQTFSIPVDAWLSELNDPSKTSFSKTAASSGNLGTVSFVQVRRSNVRLPLKEMLCQKALKKLYESGTAWYLYAGCSVFDIVASICIAKDKYKPLLISVKERKKYAMKMACDEANLQAMCMLLLIGRDKQSKTVEPSSAVEDAITMTLRSATEEKTGLNNDDLLEVNVPEDDPFGITNLVLGATGQKETSEIYSSHDYFRDWFDVESGKEESMLRASGENHVLDYLRRLRGGHGVQGSASGGMGTGEQENKPKRARITSLKIYACVCKGMCIRGCICRQNKEACGEACGCDIQKCENNKSTN